MGGLCCVALSDFLYRFATKTMTVPKSFFLPHDLVRLLYTQSPKRVQAFHCNKQILYTPHRITSDDSNSSVILKSSCHGFMDTKQPVRHFPFKFKIFIKHDRIFYM